MTADKESDRKTAYDLAAYVEDQHYYRVKAITDEKGTRPDLPDGVDWVGNTDGEYYLVKTKADLSGMKGIEKVDEEDARKFLQQITDLPGEDAIEKWRVV